MKSPRCKMLIHIENYEVVSYYVSIYFEIFVNFKDFILIIITKLTMLFSRRFRITETIVT